jgi:hypothetical protein
MPISISAIAVFSRNSSPFNHFLDRPTWLLLAPEARFWELAGTILGTASAAVDRAGIIVIGEPARIARLDMLRGCPPHC